MYMMYMMYTIYIIYITYITYGGGLLQCNFIYTHAALSTAMSYYFVPLSQHPALQKSWHL